MSRQYQLGVEDSHCSRGICGVALSHCYSDPLFLVLCIMLVTSEWVCVRVCECVYVIGALILSCRCLGCEVDAPDLNQPYISVAVWGVR